MIAAILAAVVVIAVLAAGFVGEDLPGRYRAAQEEWDGAADETPRRGRA